MIDAPLLTGDRSPAELDAELLGPVCRARSKGWWLVFAALGGGVALLAATTVKTLTEGIGVWGNNIPVGWAFAIINFVFWIGIGHAGTFISAILLLLEQPWRTSINRFAEAMTLFAVVQAGFYPLMHLGRPWFFYWLVPYPSTMSVWPQFRSALPWDAAAVFTYFTVSVLFFYLGLLPDLAAMRDFAPTRARRIAYGVLALGWRGSARAYRHYRIAYGLLAGLATPLVVSVHSIVSSDFAMALVPGWHSTIFPPFFVAGAIFSGFAMVITLGVPTRRVFKLHDVITDRHLDNLGKMTLVTGWVVIYSYIIEHFLAWYDGIDAELYQIFIARPAGPNAGAYFTQQICNVVVPQFLWSPRIRQNPIALFVISILINVGMWCERFVIIVQSLQRDFLPSAWRPYTPTWVDLGMFLGTICFFLLLFLMFLRLMPFVPVSELKELAHATDARATDARDGTRGAGLVRAGIVAEFTTPEELLSALTELRRAGYHRLDAFTPFPLKEVEGLLGLGRSRLNWSVAPFWVTGVIAAYFIQWWCNAHDYPLDVGGRPPNSAPTFVPITFEMGVLSASLAAFLLFLSRAGLPSLDHPLFSVEGFDRATRDRFFVGVDALDPLYDERRLARELLGLGASTVRVAGEGPRAAGAA